jgi:two-component system LytT family response regulator
LGAREDPADASGVKLFHAKGNGQKFHCSDAYLPIASRAMIRALIVDDQPPARDDLCDLLRAHADVVVVGTAGTPGRAKTLLTLDNYDVVFLDIDLGHGEDGFELLPAVRPGGRVIFVTAFDDHAVRAFETEALDYLLKPVAPSRLARSLGRLRQPAAGSGSTAAFAAEAGIIPVKVGPVTRLLRLVDITFVASSENYTEVALAAGERLMVRRTMLQWGETLRGVQFARMHRNLIVNVAQIQRVERGPQDVMKVHFVGGRPPLEVSRRHAPELRSKLALWRAERAQSTTG